MIIMPLTKVYYFLFFAVFMLAAKPFVGFHGVKSVQGAKPTHICVKAFTKRKQEYVEDSTFDISAIQKKLANPLLALTILFSSVLTALFPFLFKQAAKVTAGFLNAIRLRLFPPQQLYLLSGKLTI